MRQVLPVLVIVSVLTASSSSAQEITTATSECYTRPQGAVMVNGKQQKPGIDLLCADIPEELIKQVEHLTGISAKNDSISMIVADLGKGRWMHHVAGRGFSAKGSGELPLLGIKQWKHDFHIRYTSLVESVSNNQLYAYGCFDYYDKLNEKQCFVAVELRGEIVIQDGSKPKLQGTTTWTGPLQNVKFAVEARNQEADRGTK